MIEGDGRNFAIGNNYYRLDDFQNASKIYSNIKNHQGFYNAGNAFYKF